MHYYPANLQPTRLPSVTHFLLVWWLNLYSNSSKVLQNLKSSWPQKKKNLNNCLGGQSIWSKYSCQIKATEDNYSLGQGQLLTRRMHQFFLIIIKHIKYICKNLNTSLLYYNFSSAYNDIVHSNSTVHNYMTSIFIYTIFCVELFQHYTHRHKRNGKHNGNMPFLSNLKRSLLKFCHYCGAFECKTLFNI